MFKPTIAMQRCRANLHRSCPPDKAVSITPNHPLLMTYISPTSNYQLRLWQESYGEEFWEWLVTPPSCDGQDLEARDLAYAALKKILGMSIGDDATSMSVDLARLQMDAAKLLLGNKGPMIAVQNNVSNGGDAPMPRGLVGKTPHQLTERLHSITRHVPDTMCIEGEVQSDGE